MKTMMKNSTRKIEERKKEGPPGCLHLTQILLGITNLLDGIQEPLSPLMQKMGIIPGLMMDHGAQNIFHL